MNLGSKKPRVLLVDDSERIVQTISSLLAEDFEVIGSAHDGAEAIKAVIRLNPDVILLDIVMPELDGIQAARRLQQMNLPIKIVFLSGLEDQEYVEASLATGASGFVFKRCAARDLPVAIREALAGRLFISTRSRMPRPLSRNRDFWR